MAPKRVGPRSNTYEVFLSHASSDKAVVERIAHRLHDAGVTVWLDKWALPGGEPFQEAIEEALARCAAVAVFVGPKGLAPWQKAEMRAAIQCRVEEERIRVIPVLLPGATLKRRDKLPAFLRAATWVELPSEDDEEAIRRLVCGIRDLPPGPAPTGTVPPIKRPGSAVDTGGERLAIKDTQLERLLYPPYEPPPATSAAGAQSLATLLKPRHQQAPFIGRVEERAELAAWAERPESGPRVRLCIGPGGEGKTRLAAEFATELQAKGWLVGFVRLDASTEELREALRAAASDVLLVVDYAGRRVDQLAALLTAAESRRCGRTALLLLERSQGEWWRELGDRLQGTRAALDAFTVAEPLRLGPLSEADRVEMLGKASVAYGRGPSSALPRDDNALSVQIAALLGISGDRDELLKELLEREGRYWRQMAAAHHLSARGDELAAVVTLATLVRPNENQARRLLKLAFERPGQIQVRGTLAWLSELYPGENSSIGSLAPDLVGEALIAEQVIAHHEMLGALLKHVDEAAAVNVFDAVTRTCLSHPQIQGFVRTALRSMSTQLWSVAVRTAPTLDETFARLLTEAFEGVPTIPHRPILAALPWRTICLR